MITAVNALLECFVTGLFTAGLLVLCTRLGWFPVMIVHTMTPEEYNESKKDDDYNGKHDDWHDGGY